MKQRPTPGPIWIRPDLRSETERGELARVAHHFAPGSEQEYIEQFYQYTERAEEVLLSEEMWRILTNTDSFDIALGDFKQVQEHIDNGYFTGDGPKTRDWEYLKGKMERSEELDMPIIVRVGGVLHLMSGNTRLMVARALGLRPIILLVDMSGA